MSIVLAHPLTESAQLGLAPAFVGLLAGVLAVGGARLLAVGGARLLVATGRPAEPAPSGIAGSEGTAGTPATLSPLEWVGRALGVGLLLLAIAAGRLGSPAQFDNIAPALVIGVGWPLLLVASAALGGVWDRMNPFDTLSRGVQRIAGATTANPHDRLWTGSLLGALGWTWWLGAYIPQGLEPRAIGLALGLYTVVILAGCVTFGREAWLSEGEVFTLTFRAIARARSAAGDPVPVRHLSTLAVLIGGLFYAELRFSRWYLSELERFGIDRFADSTVLIGYVVTVGLAVAAVHGAHRWAARHRVQGAVRALLPWLVVGLGLSAALERDRLWVSAQLLVVRASDPLGAGWDLFGTAGRGVVTWPYGDVTRLWLQVAALGVTTLVGLALAMRRVEGGRTEPLIVLGGGWLVLAVLSAASL
ncbi:hypothetical protein BH23ACT9_BH23ACT9_33800 [soil metagenome]